MDTEGDSKTHKTPGLLQNTERQLLFVKYLSLEGSSVFTGQDRTYHVQEPLAPGSPDAQRFHI